MSYVAGPPHNNPQPTAIRGEREPSLSESEAASVRGTPYHRILCSNLVTRAADRTLLRVPLSLTHAHARAHTGEKNQAGLVIRLPPNPSTPPSNGTIHFPSVQTHPEYQIEGEHQVFDAHLSSRQRGHGGTRCTESHSSTAITLSAAHDGTTHSLQEAST